MAEIEKDILLQMEKVAEKIKQLRKQNHSSSEDFANTHELNRVQYWRIEKGHNITLKTFFKILKIHNLTAEEFFKELN